MRDGWREVRLGDVFAVSAMRLGEHDDEPPVFAISKYDGLVLSSEYHANRVASKKLDTYKVVDVNDWAYSTIHIDEGSIARNTTLVKGVVSPMYTIMRWVSHSHDARYFELLLRTPAMLQTYREHAAGSVNRRRSLPWRAFSQISVQVPPIEEQRRIVDLIGDLDETITTAQKVHEQARASICDLLRSAFCCSGEIRSLESLTSSVIGGVWGSAPGSDVEEVSVVGGAAFAGGVSSVLPDRGTPRSITSKQYSSRKLMAGDIVLEVSGGSERQPVGRVIRATQVVDRTVPSNFMRLVRPNSAEVDPSYLFWKMRLDYLEGVTRDFQRNTTGIRNLQVPAYLARTISLPSRDQQAMVATMADACDEVVIQLEDEGSALTALRSELLSALLSGKHEIPTSYDELIERAGDTAA